MVPEKNRGYRCALVSIDKLGWTVLLKIKNAQTLKDSFENIPISSKKNKFIRYRQRKGFLNRNFSKFIN